MLARSIRQQGSRSPRPTTRPIPALTPRPNPASKRAVSYRQKHLLAIEGLHPPEIGHLLDLAESYVLLNRSGKTQRDLLRGRR